MNNNEAIVEQEKFDKLNNLYKSLKKLDADILAKFNHSEIADDDYFLYGIQNDIVSNALNILVNYLTGNIESAGVDNSCRIILEAMTILAMNASGDISDIQKSIYRYSYAYVDLENFKLVTTKEQFQEDRFNAIKADRNKCAKYIKKYFGCEYEDIQKQDSGVDDPCFYLKKNLKDKVVFAKLIEKYFPAESIIGNLYEFFSIMVHPRCEMYPDEEKATMEVHQHFVDDILGVVEGYLTDSKILPAPEGGSDFNSDFFYNPLLANNVHNVMEMEFAFHLAMKSLCPLPDGYDWFTWFFLEKSKYLVLDMMTSLSLGYTEHVIVTFKPFIEMFSIFYKINTVEDLTEFGYLKESYWLSSRIQFNEHIKKCGLPASNRDYKTELQTLYDSYYASRYKVGTFGKFYDKYLHNSLYFLDNSKKSFNKFVREAIEGISDEEAQSKDFMTLYKISKDMAHASGYSFNATVDFVRVMSHKVLFTTLYIIRHCLFNGVETLKEHNVNINLQPITESLELHMQMQLEAVSKIYENHIGNSDN